MIILTTTYGVPISSVLVPELPSNQVGVEEKDLSGFLCCLRGHFRPSANLCLISGTALFFAIM
jgi:hypothetical protein